MSSGIGSGAGSGVAWGAGLDTGAGCNGAMTGLGGPVRLLTAGILGPLKPSSLGSHSPPFALGARRVFLTGVSCRSHYSFLENV